MAFPPPPTEAEGMEKFVDLLAEYIKSGPITMPAIRDEIIKALDHGAETHEAIASIVALRAPFWKKA